MEGEGEGLNARNLFFEIAGFVIFDNKTYKCLESEFNLRFGKYLREPFDDLVEQDLSLYTIQLSLYALMLENIGLKVIDRKLIWLKEDGIFEKISLYVTNRYAIPT